MASPTYGFYEYPSYTLATSYKKATSQSGGGGGGSYVTSSSSPAPTTDYTIATAEQASQTAKELVAYQQQLQQSLGNKTITVRYDPQTKTMTIYNAVAPSGYDTLKITDTTIRDAPLDNNIVKQLKTLEQGKILIQRDILAEEQKPLVEPEVKTIATIKPDYEATGYSLLPNRLAPVEQKIEKLLPPVAQSREFISEHLQKSSDIRNKDLIQKSFQNQSFPKNTEFHYDEGSKTAIAVTPSVYVGNTLLKGKVYYKKLEPIAVEVQSNYQLFPQPQPTPDKATGYLVPKGEEYIFDRPKGITGISIFGNEFQFKDERGKSISAGEAGERMGPISGVLGGTLDLFAEAGRTLSEKKGIMQIQPKKALKFGINVGQMFLGGIEQGIKITSATTPEAEKYKKTGIVFPYATELTKFGISTGASVLLFKGMNKVAKAPIKIMRSFEQPEFTVRTQQVGNQYLSVAERDISQLYKLQVTTEAEVSISPVKKSIDGFIIGDISRLEKVGLLDRAYYYQIKPSEIATLKGRQLFRIIDKKTKKEVAIESKDFETHFAVEKPIESEISNILAESLRTQTFEIAGRTIKTTPQRIFLEQFDKRITPNKNKYFSITEIETPKGYERKITTTKGFLAERSGGYAEYINKQIELGRGKALVFGIIKPKNVPIGLFGTTKAYFKNLINRGIKTREFLEYEAMYTNEGLPLLEAKSISPESSTSYVKLYPTATAKLISELSIGKLPIMKYIPETTKGSSLISAPFGAGFSLKTTSSTKIMQSFGYSGDIITKFNDKYSKNAGFGLMAKNNEFKLTKSKIISLKDKIISPYTKKTISNIQDKYTDTYKEKYEQPFSNKISQVFSSKLNQKIQDKYTDTYKEKYANKFKNEFPFEPPPEKQITKPIPSVDTFHKRQIAFGLISDETGYNVYARSKGNFQKLNKQPISRIAALGLGGSATDNSAAATFKIKKTDKPAKQGRDFGGFNAFKFQQIQANPSQETYREKNTFRIDTSGEIQGISAKGWVANRQKKLMVSMGLASKGKAGIMGF